MDPFTSNQGFSLLNKFKKSRRKTSVENSIAVIGVKKALLIGEFQYCLLQFLSGFGLM